MRVIIDGKEQDFVDGLAMSRFLSERNVKMPAMVSVKLNDQILKGSDFESMVLKDEE